MDQSLIERRLDARIPTSVVNPVRATLRPGCEVILVNLSRMGALLQGGRPFRPGARVHLQVVTASRTVVLAGHVLRCAVWALDEFNGATYRGALRFEQRCETFWIADRPPAPRRHGRS
jgi:hypothetical protein